MALYRDMRGHASGVDGFSISAFIAPHLCKGTREAQSGSLPSKVSMQY